MTSKTWATTDAVPTGVLAAALGESLAGRGGARRIVSVIRQPCAYRSSFALEELDVTLDDGSSLQLVFKDVSPAALSEDGRRAKPAFVLDPMREVEAYRCVLSHPATGAPAFHGAHIDAKQNRFWLFIERVAGQPLCETGDLGLWRAAARHLATMHARVRVDALATNLTARLLRYDAQWYRRWPHRALAFMRTSESVALLCRIASRYDLVIARLLALPPAFIHGECYAANVLVQDTALGPRIRPVDWEMAAVGPSLIDLAALIAGPWSVAARKSIIDTYLDALEDHGTRLDRSHLSSALDACRLHIALQWLGWSKDWTPPPTQTRDWLTEAREAAERLGL